MLKCGRFNWDPKLQVNIISLYSDDFIEDSWIEAVEVTHDSIKLREWARSNDKSPHPEKFKSLKEVKIPFRINGDTLEV